jgi:type VI secretion system secreted protein VgrG
MALYTQTGRLISLTSPLGEDKLLLTGFTGREAISRLFHFHLTTLSEDTAIDFTTIVGQAVTINILQVDDSQRYFNGIVSHFACTGKEGDMTRYELEVVPKLWLLTRYADCRIFHNKDVTEIVKSVLDDRGIKYQASLTGTYNKLEYCVQYRETDFNFVSRLMEQFGIFYFFQHEDGEHTMILGDSSSVHQPCPGQGSAGFNLASGGLDAGDVVNSLSICQELRSGKHSLTDYNFTTSNADLKATESTIYTVAANDSMEIFDFPGLHLTGSDGTAVVKIRMQEEEAVHKIGRGTSVCRPFITGYKFELKDHPLDAMNASYLLTEIQHVATVAGTYRDDAAGGGDSYTNHFTCIPADVMFRPARITPKPFVQGPQTAKIVGKSADQDSADDENAGGDGEEIWVDKWGRVLVLFPWDRKKATSCWMRVSQDWAGAGWGMINIPRVGQEVIVSFIEGDPDRPIITGRVYNDVQLVPYKLPDHGTISTFRTSSSTGGGTDHYNELRFEDKTGKEQVFLRAEFDQDNYVKNDSREWIGNNRSLVVTKDQTDSIGGDYQESITGNNVIKIGKDRNEQVGGKEIIKIGGDRNEKVGGNEVIKIGGDANHNIGGNQNDKIGSNLSIQAGQNIYEKSGMNWAHEAGMAIHLKAGMSVVIEAGMELTLKAGGSFIDIGPAGIAISGAPLVMINSGGAAGSGSGSSPTSPTDPVDPKDPKDPDLADDGKSGTKRGSGLAGSSASGGGAAGAAGGGAAAGAAGGAAGAAGAAAGGAAGAAGAAAAGAAGAAAGAAGAAGGAVLSALNQASQAGQQAVNQAQQAAQQATQQAAQVANQAQQAAQQAAAEAQQAANQAQQAVQQAEQQAQQAVGQVQQQAQQLANQAQQAVQQAQQQVQQAAKQAQQQAQQALSQAQQAAQQVQQQAQQAVQQAEQQAQQVQQQVQQAATQAQQAAQQAQQQAQQAEQQAQQAAQQAQQQAQQAMQQGQQAVQQAQQGIQQTAQQAQQAGSQAEQQAQQAAQQAKQAQQQAQQAAQQAQQAAQQAQQQAQQAAQQAQQAGQQVTNAASQSLQQAQQSAQQTQQAAQQAISGLGRGI